MLAVRDQQRASSCADHPAAASQSPQLIPVVLPISDPATVQVLRAGQSVDLYAAYGEEAPTLVASAVALLKIDTTSHEITQNAAQLVHIVVGITPQQSELVESLLAASSIVATVSAVHF